MPKLEYPAYFEDGLLGTRCKEDIQHREAYLFVPYKMLMNCNKAQMDHTLGPIILNNPDIFSDDSNEWEQMTLTLFMFFEVSKGKDSYWQPQLVQMPEVQFTSNWDEDTI